MTTANPDWLDDPAFQDICSALTGAGKEAYAVGGCVRDSVVGVPCNDVDIATNATPDEVKALLSAAGFRMIPTGVEHGTWTVRRKKSLYEVTTYRRDVATDGRRATVEFADTKEEDAERRDFTMNALYMDQEGNIYDPTGDGLADLSMGLVRFVGDANQRCEEDLLRILRLFRFHAKYGCGDWVETPIMELDSILAAEKYADQIVKIVSGERIWDETKKIMSAADPYPALIEMTNTGVAKAVYGHDPNFDALIKLLNAENARTAKPMWHRRYLAAFGKEIPFPAAKAERRKLEELDSIIKSDYGLAALGHIYGQRLVFDRHVMLGECGPFDSEEVHRGVTAKFPVTSEDLMNEGMEPGRQLGDALKFAKDVWVRSDLNAQKGELIAHVMGY